MYPIKVYLDQNVFGHMLDSGSDWHKHPLAIALLQTHCHIAQCWISPTHIIEVMQCTDPARRQSLAKIMLEIIGARRMWFGSDFLMVEKFAEFLNSHVPGAFNPDPFFNEYKINAERLWLGYLGLLAASQEFPNGPGVEKVRLLKAQTELIHARIASDPDNYIDRIVKAARDFETTLNPDPLGLSSMTLEQIEQEILNLRDIKTRPTQQTIMRLKKERSHIAATYGAVDIGGAINAVFRMPCDLELTFNAPLIVKNWSNIKKLTGCVSLPKEIVMEEEGELRSNQNHVITVLRCCIHAAACARLHVASIGYYTLLRELEVKLNQEELPKGSVTLDVDHAISCLAFDVFVCHDKALHENMRAFINGNNLKEKAVIRESHELDKLIANCRLT